MKALACLTIFPVIALLSECSSAVDGSKLMLGIPLSKGHLYDSTSKTFTCLSGQKTIPFARVNDDYCDCEDGSDEPGTSACSQGRFYCVNKGHRGRYIFSSRVKDQVCDCCDGSDEAPGVCRNTCSEQADKYLKELGERVKIFEAGSAKKKEYIEEAKQAFAGKEEEVIRLEEDLKKKEADLNEAEIKKATEEELETQERANLSVTLDQAAEQLGLAELQKEDLISLVANITSHLAKESWITTQMFGEAVVDNIIAAREKRGFGVPQALASKDDSDSDAFSKLKAITKPADDYKRPEAEDARNTYNSAYSEVTSLKSKVEDLKKEVEVFYGPQREYFPLKGKCWSVQQQKYKYEVCPFGKASQDSISLGNFQSLDASGKEHVMKFSGGLSCWNGPARSMTVTLLCGLTEEVYDIDEPETCLYTAKMRTPAACTVLPDKIDLESLSEAHGVVHDEL